MPVDQSLHQCLHQCLRNNPLTTTLGTHFPNALPDPWAVMVEPLDAVVADTAVGTSRWPEQCTAKTAQGVDEHHAQLVPSRMGAEQIGHEKSCGSVPKACRNVYHNG